MTNQEIVDKYLQSGLIRKCVDMQFEKLRKEGQPWKLQYKEDLFQDVIVYLLTYDNDKMNDADINNHFNALITRILINQLWSKSSKFYTQYLKFNNSTSDFKYDPVSTYEEE